MNNFEVEMKFPIPSYGKEKLIEKLKLMGSEDLGKEFENNVILENNESYLENIGSTLRVRDTGDKVKITFKGKHKKEGEFKVREEIETLVGNFDKIMKILSRLGFKPIKIYQKHRRTLKLGDTMITIDELPFGDFIEIEGTKDEITRISSNLSLERKTISNMNYFELYHYMCEKDGSKPMEHIIFPGYDISKVMQYR